VARPRVSASRKTAKACDTRRPAPFMEARHHRGDPGRREAPRFVPAVLGPRDCQRGAQLRSVVARVTLSGTDNHNARRECMISPKTVLLWISAGILFVSLGLFTVAATDRPAMAAGPAVSPISESAAQPQVQSETPAGDEQPCPAEAAEQPSTSSESAIPADAICGPTATWQCCRCGSCATCGGCSCRPNNISPGNWCAGSC
jgi:hypothetical protein